ncbi:MAG: glycosyltransferase [Phycisphaerae bacterium]|nr:glycosyltransferase [Phycisphaerae bacterium]
MHAAVVYLSGGGLSGGARNTLQALVTELRRDRRVEKLDLFVPPQAVSLPEVAPLCPNTWPTKDRLLGFPALKRKIRLLRPDVVFIPTAAWFDAGNAPVVCMVRNMEALLSPFGENPWPVGVKNVLRAQIARRACRKAGRVIAVSNFVRDFLVNRWRLTPEKIGVVYHGVAEAPAGEQVPRPEGLAQPDKPFWFSAGSFIPYRGYEDVLRALALRVRAGRDERLVLAGVPVYSDAYRNRVQALAEKLGLASRVQSLGYIDADRMAWCFRRATGFIMSSRLEACPNLVLEALANGAASISTTHPPMPELYGSTAVYYQAGETDSLVRAMEQISAMTPPQRQAAAQAARNRAREFSWPAAAERTIEQLLLAAGK